MTVVGPVSVVMPVYNGADTLDQQLASLARQEYPGSWELVIADNGSQDGSREIAASWVERIPNLRVVDASTRRGCAAADNIGAASAEGAALVFCDQDDVVQPGWLAAMARALQTHDLVVGVNKFDAPETAPPRRVSPPSVGSSPRRPRRAGERDFYGFLPAGLSCNLGVSRRAFEVVGGFDETLKGGDDLDLCWRLQLAGFAMHVQPGAVVAKRHRATARGIWEQHFNYGLYDVVLFEKFRSHGMPRRLGRAMRRYAWLTVHLPDLVRRGRRLSWTRVAAAQAGRLVGSLRQRTLYL